MTVEEYYDSNGWSSTEWSQLGSSATLKEVAPQKTSRHNKMPATGVENGTLDTLRVYGPGNRKSLLSPLRGGGTEEWLDPHTGEDEESDDDIPPIRRWG